MGSDGRTFSNYSIGESFVSSLVIGFQILKYCLTEINKLSRNTSFISSSVALC